LSSLPSEQSSSLLHFQSKRIQRPLLHGNWDSSHFALAPSAAVHRQARASSRQSALQRVNYVNFLRPSAAPAFSAAPALPYQARSPGGTRMNHLICMYTSWKGGD
uniref:Uncharacterized protein n=1 Tax=Anas platyrhynchos TaxID=8839 RepID=A0A8B9QQR6_ANAPL